MLSMDERADDELSVLRRRAYGPDADIDGDAAALDRLRELENRGRVRETVAVPPDDVSQPHTAADRRPAGSSSAVASRSSADIDVLLARVEAQEDVQASAALTPPRIGRALLIGWAASIVVVAVAVGALVFGLASLRPVSAVSGARQVASLDQTVPSPTGEDAWFGSPTATTYYSYSGLIVVVAENLLGPTTTGRCLVITSVAALSGEDASRPSVPACGAEPFHPTASILVERSSPDALRAAFPVGTALQFVWDGTAVAVFAADPPAASDAPA